MSESDSDYNIYSSDEESDVDDVKVVVAPKHQFNAAKKFGNYVEDDEDIIDDSEPDNDMEGGASDDEDDDEDDDKKEDDEKKDGDVFGPDETVSDDEDEDTDDDIDIDEDGEPIEKQTKKSTKPQTKLILADDDYDDDDDDDVDETYLQKFDSEINKNYIFEFHPECLNHNYDEVLKLAKVVRNKDNIIIDELHRTIPYLTKYERARILGQRAKQIETGSKPFVKVPENVIDGYIIAELELREKKIPFIIKRPIPGGAFEYWHVKDLEML